MDLKFTKHNKGVFQIMKQNNFQSKLRKNHQIRAKQVRLIDSDGSNVGVVSFVEAIRMAQGQGLDLIEINSKSSPVVAKIDDYGKFKYDQSKKEKAIAKKQREQSSKIKEIKFRPSTGMNDLQTKAKQAVEFLEHGHKVKISILFKGRELSHKEIAYDTLDDFLAMIPDVQIIKRPAIEGRSLSVMTAKT